MALNTLPAGAFADDAITSAKINLANTFAFTGTVTGAVDSKTTCKAFVRFNGTGTVAITSSFNVSSITDHATGDYTINFSSAFGDTNYCPVAIGVNELTLNNYQGMLTSYGSPATGSIRCMTNPDRGGSASDPNIFAIQIFDD
jgi:hypothetical protein|tara:strand:+ start:242 stop:670 length:429 start_codon:yes stop_codon:yes gene_type:complete